MSAKSLAEKAAALAAKRHAIREPRVIDCAEALDPRSGKPIYRFKVVSALNANGRAHAVILNEQGEALETMPALEQLFDRTVLTTAGASGAALITIEPDSNVLTLNPRQVIDETLTLTIPKKAGPVKADVYFLADTTGSMAGILNAVQAGANNVLAALSGLPVDIAFGVGNYKDLASRDPYGFQHQVSLTNLVTTVATAISTWSANGGGDLPEAGLFALDSLAVPPGPGIGWRAGSKRIIVWFGDAASHDPICPAVSGVAAVSEASATAKLVTQNIAVLAVSTANPGLDDDPKAGATGYVAQCGPPGGLSGQATRIATATGGAIAKGIHAGNIVSTIINLVRSAVGSIQNVKLVPTALLAPFVTSINPPGGYGPLSGDQDHTLTFDVKLTGIPCISKEQVITGTIDVVADGQLVASEKVQITVPPCMFVYSVKFICGVQQECGCECAPVQPGTYATEISIHNYSPNPVEVVKRFVPVVLAGAAPGREPRTASARAEEKLCLGAYTATMDDCCRIAELLFGEAPSSPIPLTIGFLELKANADIAVTAVYTSSGVKSGGGVSIEVEPVLARR